MNQLMEGMIAAIQNAVKDIEKDGYPDAIKKLDAIIETKDVVSQSLVQRGRCHWEMRNWDTALPDFELALKMEPDNPDIRWTCALIHLQMGNFDKGWSLIDSRWDSERFDSASENIMLEMATRSATELIMVLCVNIQ